MKTAYEYWDAPVLPTDPLFVEKVRGNIAEAHVRAFETLGGEMPEDFDDRFARAGVTGPQGARHPDDREVPHKPNQRTCVVDGCDNPITAKRGIGVYCAVLQSNGKTHRQERIELLKAEGRGPGGQNRKAKRGPYKKNKEKVVRPAKNREKVFDNGHEAIGMAFDRINQARKVKEKADKEVMEAEDSLRKLLEEKLKSLNDESVF